MTTKSRRDEHTEATRAAVTTAAKRLFVKRGFGSTSIDDVAEAARVSKGAVYHHFRDKSELFEAIFRAEQSGLVARVIAAGGENEDAWERVLTCVNAYIEGCLSSASHLALLGQAGGALGVEKCRQIDEAIALPLLRAAFEPLIAHGVVVPLPLEMLVHVVFSALCEAAMTAAAAPDPGKSASEAERVLRALLGGLRAMPSAAPLRRSALETARSKTRKSR